jgi:hypothetical protein
MVKIQGIAESGATTPFDSNPDPGGFRKVVLFHETIDLGSRGFGNNDFGSGCVWRSGGFDHGLTLRLALIR